MAPRKRKFGPLYFEMFEERKEFYKVKARTLAQMAALQAHNEGLTHDPARLMKVLEEVFQRDFVNGGELHKQALLRLAASQRQRDGINRARPPASKAQRILALPADMPASEVAALIGCTPQHVSGVRRRAVVARKSIT